MFSLEELFCCVDDFCKTFEPQWERQLLGNGLQQRRRLRSLCLSEIMTILIGFHQSCYRNFKTYYLEKVQLQWQSAFPCLVSKRAICRVDSQHPAVPACLSACLLWHLYGHQFSRFYQPPSLPQSPYQATSSVQEPGSTRQDIRRLVLWLQTTPGGQRQRRVAQFCRDTW